MIPERYEYPFDSDRQHLNDILLDIVREWVTKELSNSGSKVFSELMVVNLKLIYSPDADSVKMRKFFMGDKELGSPCGYLMSRVQDLFITIHMRLPDVYIDELIRTTITTLGKLGYQVETSVSNYPWWLLIIIQYIMRYEDLVIK